MSLPQQCLPLPQNSRKRRSPSDDRCIVESSSHHHQQKQPINDEISSLQSMDAMEYLAFVRRQASELPDIFVSKIAIDTNINNDNTQSRQQHCTMPSQTPIDGSAAARDYLLSHRLNIIPPPSPLHVPPLSLLNEWVQQTLSNFSSLRSYLHACRGEFKKCTNNNTTTTTTRSEEDKIRVPPSKDLYAWHVFCLGNEIRNEMEHQMIHVHILQQNDHLNGDDGDIGGDDDRDHDDVLTAVEVDLLLSPYNIPQGGYEPTTRLMCQFDQIIIRKLISHHTRYIAVGCAVTTKRIKWIYAILARLDKPLHRDEASVLMELLRELCRVRSSMMENQLDIIKAINVVILLIGVYFEQYSHVDKLLTYHDDS
mmetsp:Transcript_7806/g.14708  ORF Transcript_7806/g.14708 Transcript_7806/m.14708 type:complete len:367 (-) Transcript_7806:109-1209(-)|eukprot:CAMPEP_0176493400 /NCGR_PEP_ID=MMETSP0200_2-20121128/9530_1 /TAXON_ID=947934 /ORGANISM="Chaetoceros sp., Strain GSL56" /LENGTH=366 /DNA_ID=CAMNT_0017891063 /DNA_START=11 /DNA_END=1111 /DNA_ORIENTATION=-